MTRMFALCAAAAPAPDGPAAAAPSSNVAAAANFRMNLISPLRSWWVWRCETAARRVAQAASWDGATCLSSRHRRMGQRRLPFGACRPCGRRRRHRRRSSQAIKHRAPPRHPSAAPRRPGAPGRYEERLGEGSARSPGDASRGDLRFRPAPRYDRRGRHPAFAQAVDEVEAGHRRRFSPPPDSRGSRGRDRPAPLGAGMGRVANPQARSTRWQRGAQPSVVFDEDHHAADSARCCGRGFGEVVIHPPIVRDAARRRIVRRHAAVPLCSEAAVGRAATARGKPSRRSRAAVRRSGPAPRRCPRAWPSPGARAP